jgi:hypothetical protein
MSFANSTINVRNNATTLATVADPETSGTKLPLYRSLGADDHLSVSDFLAKPIRLYTYNGSGGTMAATDENFANDFIQHLAVQQKLKFSRLVRGTFVIDIVLTSQPYAIGQIVACNFMGPFSQYNAPLVNDTALAVAFDTKNHVILDMATTNTASMHVPLRTKNPYIVVSRTDSDLVNHQFGIACLTPIVNSQDGTASPFTVSVFVSMINTEIAIPVIEDDGSIYTSEVQRTADGPLSYPMTVLSAATAKLAKVPVIGPFALATSVISGAIGQVASIFGYSRPVDLSSPPYPHEEDFTTAVGEIRSKTLCLDPTNETSFPGTHVGDSGDSLTFQNILCRWGIIEFTNWSTGTVRGTTLDYIPVTPGYSSQVYSNVWALSPLSYGSMMYQLWRGTTEYEITIPCNHFVRGKLRVGWSPTIISNTVTKYSDITQNMPSVVIDLSLGSQITLKVPWGSYRSYLNVYAPPDDLKLTTREGAVNGYLYFIVEDPLVAQAAALTLTIITRVRAGQDYQLQIPDVTKLQTLHRQLYNAEFGGNTTIQTDVSQPQGSYVTGVNVDTYNTDGQYDQFTMEATEISPVLEQTHSLLPTSSNEYSTLVHMGEMYTSFRPALQRFYPYYFFRPGTGTAGGISTTHFPYLPWEPLFNSTGVGNTTYPPMMMTPLRWLSNLFYGVHGTIRYRLSPGSVGSTNYLPRINFYRSFDYPFFRRYGNTDPAIVRWIRGKSYAGMGEASFVPSNGESVIVDAPYQFVSQYLPTAKNGEIATTTGYGYGITMSMMNPQPVGTYMELYAAAGEGFNPVIWNGVPLLASMSPGSTTGALLEGEIDSLEELEDFVDYHGD